MYHTALSSLPSQTFYLCNAQSIDFSGSYVDILAAYDSVDKWTAPQKAEFNLSFWPMGPRHKAEPKGVVFIIAPFNGPLIMLLSPLVQCALLLITCARTHWGWCSRWQVGAIAGGNAAVLKPSEQTPATSALLAELVPKYLDNDLFHVLNGGVPETTLALELQWDHSAFAGNFASS